MADVPPVLNAACLEQLSEVEEVRREEKRRKAGSKPSRRGDVRRALLALGTFVLVCSCVDPAERGPAERGRFERGPIEPGAPGELVEGIRDPYVPGRTYTLYLPSGYTPERRWPGLLVFDPKGRSVAAVELFRPAAEKYGWAILSPDDVESSDPWGGPDPAAATTLWRVAIAGAYELDWDRIYAAGSSRAAELAWELSRKHELAGVIISSGREPSLLTPEMGSPTFGAAGDVDFNHSPLLEVHAELDRRDVPNRFETFEGPHGGMPAELAAEGVEWLELQAMKQGLRPRDGELIEALFSKDVGRARELESAGRKLDAMRRYRAIAATFEGLREVDVVEREAARLAGLPEVERARELKEHWDAYEATYLERLWYVVQDERESREPQEAVRRLSADLRLAELSRRAEAETYDGKVARRLLEALWHLIHSPDDPSLHRYHRRLVTMMTLAAEIRPERPDVWYNLAVALVSNGSHERALESLERAIDAGFDDAVLLASDPELESLRREEGFRRLVARLGG